MAWGGDKVTYCDGGSNFEHALLFPGDATRRVGKTTGRRNRVNMNNGISFETEAADAPSSALNHLSSATDRQI